MMTFRAVVLVPTIRFDAWLDECVESLLLQDTQAFRIQVIADGVPPPENLPKWAQQPSVEILFLPQRGGVTPALLAGISRSDEEFIARLDSDDTSSPERISTQMAYLDDNPRVPLVGARAMRVDEAGRTIGPFPGEAGYDVRPQLLERNHLVASTSMFRREAYEAVGGFNPTFEQMEDYELWLRLALLGPVTILPDFLVNYRLHQAQLSRGAAPRGNYVSAVIRTRRQLGRQLGVHALKVNAMTERWRLAQYLRYYRVRRPGYDR